MLQSHDARPFVYRDHICWAERMLPGDGWTGVSVFKGKPTWTSVSYPSSAEAIAAVKTEVDHHTAVSAAAPKEVLQKTWQNGLFDL
ncbi:MAG TPA: hypothetical protein V6D06_01875 [Trichocoleus sp.]